MNIKSLKEYKKNSALFLFIFLAAVLSRWLAFFAGWIISKSDTGFADAIYSAFIKAGDTPHYLEIAKNWYTSSGENQNLIVFFPLYPILIRICYILTGNYFASGLIISNLSFGIGSVFFYKLLRIDFDQLHSSYGLLGLLLFPFSFFGAAIYTEGLFLLTSVLSLYFMRKNKFIAAGVCGLLCTLTRMQGLSLIFVFLYEALLDSILSKKLNYRALIACFLTGLGFLIYLSINKIIYGDWFKYIQFQSEPPWYNTPHWIGTNLKQHYEMSQNYKELSLYIYWPQIILFFICTVSILYGLKTKIRTSYLVYTGVYLAATYLHGWQISGGRYVSMCITLFIVYASIQNKRLQYFILLISGLFYTFLSALWIMGFSIM